MANIFAEVLSIASRRGVNVTLRIRYNLIFEQSEVGQRYEAKIAIFPHDSGTTWIPKPLTRWRTMPDQIIARRGLMQMSHDITLPKGMLNEDKSSKDEIYARIELEPPYDTLRGKTPLLISEFK